MYGVCERSAILKMSVVGRQKGSNRRFGVGWLGLGLVRKPKLTPKKISDTQAPFGRLASARGKHTRGIHTCCDGATYQGHILVTPGTCREYIDAAWPRF